MLFSFVDSSFVIFVSLDSVDLVYEGGILAVAFALFKGELYVFVGEVLLCNGFFTDMILTGDLYVLLAPGEEDDNDGAVILVRAGELLDLKLDAGNNEEDDADFCRSSFNVQFQYCSGIRSIFDSSRIFKFKASRSLRVLSLSIRLATKRSNCVLEF